MLPAYQRFNALQIMSLRVDDRLVEHVQLAALYSFAQLGLYLAASSRLFLQLT